MRRTSTAIVALAALLVLAVSEASAASLQLLHHFSGPDGGGPVGRLVDRGDGYLYGVASYGGIVDPATNPDGHGTVYRVDAAGAFQTLHTFDRLNGQRPNGLALGPDRFLYGTTSHGGDLDPSSPTGGQGTLFRIDAAGKLTVLHRFMPVEGSWPSAAPTFGPDGTLYGTSRYDSTYPHYGTVWRWSPEKGLQVLHQFTGSDGREPLGPLTLAADGNLYGTTKTGSGWGTVFRLDAAGNATTLHAFDAYGSTGMKPTGALYEASDGYLYGTAQLGGQPLSDPDNRGVLFRTSLSGALSVVHTFSTADGSTPTSGVMQWTDGAIYGVAPVGGAFNRGVVYRVGLFEGPALASLSLSQSVVKAGWTVQGTVRLSSGAPSGGAVVTLASSDQRIAAVPPAVTLAEGQTSATFLIRTKRARTGTVTIRASSGGVTQSVQLIVAR
jgi:uncharacterized repeat protein (TIGR03803 family)